MKADFTISNTAGLILAGGRSRRMSGHHKGSLLTPEGKTFMDQIAEEMHQLTDLVYLSYGETVPLKVEGCRIVRDEYKDCGPLGGLHASLKAAEAEGVDSVMTAACDMPFIKADLYRFLYEHLKGYDGVVAGVGDHIHPLAAIYRVKTVRVFEEQLLAGNYKLRDALKYFPVKYVDLEGTAFSRMLININTGEEYAKLSALR